MWDNLTEKKPDNLVPSESIRTVKTDLKQLDLSKDAVVWFGHSSYLLINSGKKILVDPVLTTGFPASLMMKPFKGRTFTRRKTSRRWITLSSRTTITTTSIMGL